MIRELYLTNISIITEMCLVKVAYLYTYSRHHCLIETYTSQRERQCMCDTNDYLYKVICGAFAVNY